MPLRPLDIVRCSHAIEIDVDVGCEIAIVIPDHLRCFSHRDFQELLRRHLSGDWGDLGTTYEGSEHYGG